MRTTLVVAGCLWLLAACEPPPPPEAARARQLEAEYNEQRAAVHAKIEQFRSAGKNAQALAAAERYALINDAALNQIIDELRVATRKDRERELLAKVKATKASDYTALLIYYAELERLDPDNQEYKHQWTRARQAADKADAEAHTRALAAERAARRKEGVSIGMSKEEVLMSNWGRPTRINRTSTARGTREQWVYSIGYLYFNEDGVLTTVQH